MDIFLKIQPEFPDSLEIATCLNVSLCVCVCVCLLPVKSIAEHGWSSRSLTFACFKLRYTAGPDWSKKIFLNQ